MVAYSAVEGHDSTCTSSTSSSSSSTRCSPPRAAGQDADPPVGAAPEPRPKSLPSALPTHFPPFASQRDYRIIMDTAAELERSGFYWGPLGVAEAHAMLRGAPLGSYLLRDSRQKDVFFTLSYRSEAGAVSVRIVFRRQRFGLAGSERSFVGLFELLQHYAHAPRSSLGAPYRRRAATLQELCRRRIAAECGSPDSMRRLPVSGVLRDFLSEFPYGL